MEKAKKCIGEFGTKCQADATHWVDCGHEIYAVCDVCYKKYDAMSRRATGRSVEAEAKRQRLRVS